jgi:hypothetical protein
MDTDKNGLNTKTIRRFFPLSANGVGEEGRGEVAHKTQIPSPCPSSRLGGAGGKASRISELYPCSSAQISERNCVRSISRSSLAGAKTLRFFTVRRPSDALPLVVPTQPRSILGCGFAAPSPSVVKFFR